MFAKEMPTKKALVKTEKMVPPTSPNFRIGIFLFLVLRIFHGSDVIP